MFVDDMMELLGGLLSEDEKGEFREQMASWDPEEAARHFGRAAHVLDGYLMAAEDENEYLFAVLFDAKRRAGVARRIASEAGYASG